MSSHLEFARNLVKGKIAETVFAQMLRESGEFTVLEFGYEKVIPELVMNGINQNAGIMETLRSAPDFAVINKKTRQVHLIEVKYMRKINDEYMLKHAERMVKSWNPAYLFVATLDGFYSDEINEIVKNQGAVKPLIHEQIAMDLQSKYLKILQDFEGMN